MADTKTLVQALAEFQKELPQVGLDSTNPAFKSKYASLGAVTKAVIPKLTEHGFAFSVGSFVDNGLLVVDAHLIHESGESRSLQFPITETLPQKIGSAITYARRYALAALTGVVADEDDDGNAASTQSPTEARVAAAKATPQPRATATPSKRPTPKDSQEAIRIWIDWRNETELNGPDASEVRKNEANSTSAKLKKDEPGLKGEAHWKVVREAVGA